MKVVFLDLDGVLTLEAQLMSIDDWHGDEASFDAACVAALNRVVAGADIRVVVSSSRRIGRSKAFMTELFAQFGLCAQLHDDWRTPDLGGPRGHEVQAWLAEHSDVTSFVIIDDDDDFADEQLAHFVRTSWDGGFGLQHAERALSILD